MSRMHHSEGVITVGPEGLRNIPLTSMNDLEQVRTTYDEHSIAELAQAIWAKKDETSEVTSDHFSLLSPPVLGVHSLKSARRYISAHGDFFGISKANRIDPQNLVPLSDDKDRAPILIAGHRRKRAILYNLEKHNVMPDRVQVASYVHDDIPFEAAIELQLRENVHDRPSPQDEARAIELTYRYRETQTGKAPTIKELAGMLGFSETKIRNAIAFASLPESIQQYAYDGVFSFTTTLDLKPLLDAYKTYYNYDTKSQLESAARAEGALLEFCNVFLLNRLKGSDARMAVAIANQVKTVEQMTSQEYLAFDFDLVSTPEVARRKQLAQSLSRQALAVLKYQLRTAGINASDLQELSDLLRNEQYRTHQGPVQLPIDFGDDGRIA